MVLVLPATFFHRTLLITHGGAGAFKEQNCYHFIANLLIEVTAGLPENRQMAVTSERAFDELEASLVDRALVRGAPELLEIFRNLVVIISTASINALGDCESMIAIADRLNASSSYDPVIVANADGMENYRAAAAKYYGIDPKGFSSLDIPFKILDPREAKVYLEAKYPLESLEVLKRTDLPFRMF
ncbi:MAG: hypothetical protein L3K13_04485 [Thermoplasmata archaeon]|nr:hypothetical protein [Thermoplasmata archaeon]